MDQFASFLKMGGYAAFVWPAFGIAIAVMAGFVVSSLRTLRAREATLRALEAAAPENPRRRRRMGTSEASASGEAAANQQADA